MGYTSPYYNIIKVLLEQCTPPIAAGYCDKNEKPYGSYPLEVRILPHPLRPVGIEDTAKSRISVAGVETPGAISKSTAL